jgi:hypothetical protein
MTSAIGRIERVPLRDVWPHEALDFSTWLEANIDILNEYLPVPIDPDTVAREASAGSFSIDLIAEDSNGSHIVIENQLERSNHDHLGKLITYAAVRGATTAIWLVSDPRDEHVRAMSWLNDSGTIAFWLFKIEAIKIGDSLPAPVLTKIVGPAEEIVVRPPSNSQSDAREQSRRQFFERLLEYAEQRTNLHKGVRPSGHPWVGRNYRGVSWVYGVRTSGTRVMLYIERGQGRLLENDAIFESLLQHRDDIEAKFGAALTWEAKETNRSRTIGMDFNDGGWETPNLWNAAIETTVDAMIRLDGAISPFLSDALGAADDVTSNLVLAVSEENEDMNDD